MRLTLDTEDDYKLFQHLWNRFGKRLVAMKISDLNNYLNNNPEIRLIFNDDVNRSIRDNINTELDFRVRNDD